MHAVCVCSASSSVWVHSVPLYSVCVCVCEYRAEPFVSKGAVQVELYSTDLHIFHSIEWPSQIIKCPFISKGHWQGLSSKTNTERPVWGHCPSHCGLQHCGW